MLPINIFPTASNIAIFIDGIHIELAYGLQYKENAPKIPIYGYNDGKFNSIAYGKSLVQGALVMSFVFPGYLMAVLDRASADYSPKLYNYDLSSISKTAGYYPSGKLKNYLKEEMPPNGSDGDRRARAEFISDLLSNKDPIKKAQAKKALQKHFDPDDVNIPKNTSSIIGNPLTSNTRSKTVNGHNIDLYYQDPEFATFFTRFIDVNFTEVSQQMSQAGAEGSAEPLYLIYQFIAKEVETRKL